MSVKDPNLYAPSDLIWVMCEKSVYIKQLRLSGPIVAPIQIKMEVAYLIVQSNVPLLQFNAPTEQIVRMTVENAFRKDKFYPMPNPDPGTSNEDTVVGEEVPATEENTGIAAEDVVVATENTGVAFDGEEILPTNVTEEAPVEEPVREEKVEETPVETAAEATTTEAKTTTKSGKRK